MIGNDIIDLRLAEQESRWQRKGFLEKLFTTHEQELILRSATPEIMVWLLWSCKEAVYKIVNRCTQVRAYAPWKFAVIDYKNNSGTVLYSQQSYPVTTFLSGNCIHTVAVSRPLFFDHLSIHTEKDTFTPFPGISVNQDGIPYFLNTSHSAIPVSISHHGRYYGRVMLNP